MKAEECEYDSARAQKRRQNEERTQFIVNLDEYRRYIISNEGFKGSNVDLHMHKMMVSAFVYRGASLSGNMKGPTMTLSNQTCLCGRKPTRDVSCRIAAHQDRVYDGALGVTREVLAEDSQGEGPGDSVAEGLNEQSRSRLKEQYRTC